MGDISEWLMLYFFAKASGNIREIVDFGNIVEVL